LATEQGFVIKTCNTTAIVKTTRKDACASCASKDSCSAIGEEMEVEVINLAGAKEGDKVVLSLKTSRFLKATFFLYVFPIICMIIGSFIGDKLSVPLGFNNSALSALISFSFFLIAICLVRFRGKKMGDKEEYRPKIIRIIK
jgi:sigma-E factor negative regulatory protein RseC